MRKKLKPKKPMKPTLAARVATLEAELDQLKEWANLHSDTIRNTKGEKGEKGDKGPGVVESVKEFFTGEK